MSQVKQLFEPTSTKTCNMSKTLLKNALRALKLCQVLGPSHRERYVPNSRTTFSHFHEASGVGGKNHQYRAQQHASCSGSIEGLCTQLQKDAKSAKITIK